MDQPPLAARMSGFSTSAASRMRARVQELRASGVNVLDLASGDLDFDTPDGVLEAAHRAALRGQTRYTNTAGTRAFKDAVRRKFETRNQLTFADDEVIGCTGSTQAIFEALFATVAPGDEVIIPSPYWSQYLNQVKLAGGTPVLIGCPQNNGYKLRADDLHGAIGPRTRWLILNNPANPSGAVYSRSELSAIAEVALKYPNLWVLEDTLYEDITFDGRRTSAIAEVAPLLKSRTLTVGGVAKSYAMMGWRIGYAGGPRHLIRAMINIQSQITSCASSIGQAAAIAALANSHESMQEMHQTLAANRDYLVSTINRVEGLACTAPEGTFYLLISSVGILGKVTPKGLRLDTDRNFSDYLLEDAGVAVAAGEDFGLSPYVRASFGVQRPTLEAAVERLLEACAALR